MMVTLTMLHKVHVPNYSDSMTDGLANSVQKMLHRLKIHDCYVELKQIVGLKKGAELK